MDIWVTTCCFSSSKKIAYPNPRRVFKVLKKDVLRHSLGSFFGMIQNITACVLKERKFDRYRRSQGSICIRRAVRGLCNRGMRLCSPEQSVT